MRIRIKALGVVAVLGSAILHGQGTTGTITGTVTDPSGAVIPGASVVAHNLETNEERNATTSEVGTYEFTTLIPGTYRLQVSKAGFASAVVNSIQLLVKQERQIDVELKAGTTTENVTVSAASVSLDTENPAQSEVVTANALSTLPLNGGNYVALTQLAAGATPITGQVGAASGVYAQSGGRANTSVSIGGNREQDITYTYDGVESKSYWLGLVALYPPMDAIAEFKVQQGYLSPEFAPPVVVNLIMKSGTDEFHGSAFEFLRNDDFDALNYFDTQRLPFHQNQFGIDGGYRFPHTDRHHFYAYYQGFRVSTSSTAYGDVPSAQELKGDFTDLVPAVNGGGCPYDPQNFTGNCLPTTSSQLIDPNTGQPFSTANVIPAGRINSLASALAPYFSTPNRTMDQLGNYSTSVQSMQDDNQFGIRTDHTLSAKDNVHVRFSYSNSAVNNGGLFPAGGTQSPIDVRNLGVNWIHLFSPNLINEVRVGYNNLTLGGLLPANGYNPTKLGFANVTDVAGCASFPTVYISQSSGFVTDAGNCYGSHDRDWLMYDSLTWVRGQHSLSFGADVRRVSHLVYDQDSLDGTIFYFNAFSGSNTADFMLGDTSFAYFGLGNLAATNDGWWSSWYGNDDYKVNKKLTLNLGLRYMNNQILTPEEHNYSYVDLTTGTLLHPPQDGLPPGVANHAWLDFAPRVGLAYELTRSTVVRSSYGIYFVDDPADELSFNAGSPPTFGTYEQSTNGPGTLTYTVNQGQPTDLLPPVSLIANIPATGTPDGSIGLFTRDRYRKSPYVQEWSLSVQRTLPWQMLLDLAYEGNEGTHLSKRVDENTASPLNGPPCDTNPGPGCDPRTIQQRRPFPNWASIFRSGNFATSNYNALQVTIQKSLSQGLSFLTAYTWGKAISEDDYDNLASRNYSRLALNLDRSRANYDRKQRLSMSISYALPFARDQHGFVKSVAGGWELEMINSFTTGAPFGVSTSGDYAQIGNVYGFARPDQVCNGNLPVNQRTLTRWFNTSCFIAPVNPYPHLGDTKYNVLDAPGITQADLSIQKTFPITEALRVRFQGDAFNVFNVPNFGQPGNYVDSPGFGTISSALPAREIQVALKAIW